MNFYRRFPGDYLKDTQHLTTFQHGCYGLLLDTLYATEKPIESIQEAFEITKCRTRFAQKACLCVVHRHFTIDDCGHIWHSRVERELKYAESRKKKASLGGKMRWQKDAPSMLQAKRVLDTRHQTPETPKPTTAAPPLDLPVWLPEPTWKAFSEMRGKMRAPLTPHASLLIFKKLARWMEAGQNPQEVLEQSIENGWKGIFEVRKENGNGRKPIGPISASEAFRRTVRNFSGSH